MKLKKRGGVYLNLQGLSINLCGTNEKYKSCMKNQQVYSTLLSNT